MTKKNIAKLTQLNLQIIELAGQGNLEQAIIVAQEAVNIGINQQLTEHPAYCDSLNNLAELYRMQGRYSEAVGKARHTPKLHIKPYDSTAAIQLSQLLFEPIYDWVKDCKHLIIAPDGNLNLVPFQILPLDSTGTRLLMDEYTISYLSVGRDILRTKVQPLTGSISAPLIILLSTEHLRTAKVENPMMRSGLALAGANTWLFGGTLPKKAGKGFVFAQDIASLDLWANELTVLSACDTARGDIKIGEGVFGLRRAFAVAGTKTLVMSLWKVPDKVTALLMERFFDNLQSGMNRGNALQNAQVYIRNITVTQLRKSALGIEVLKELLGVKELSADSKIDCQEEDTPFQHPFYWGAWICQGDTKPLVLEVLN
jgi:hypothetical protein